MDSLNKQQKQAVISPLEHTLILAGAGAGKTKTLISRIVHLAKNEIPSYKILAITFTNKAAKEMKERLDHIDEPELNLSLVKIGTFHSIAYSMIKEEPELFGFNNGVSVIDDAEQRDLIHSILKEQHYSISLSDVSNFICSNKENLILPENIKKTALNNDLVEVYKRYEVRLMAENKIDFSGLLIKFKDVLENNIEYRTKIAKRYLQILVDEFQDTNNVQFDILKLMCSEKAKLFCVGDDAQSIYKFRGANVGNIFDYRDNYAKQVFLLEQNYRSSQNIVSISNKLIEQSKERLEKTLFTKNLEGDQVSVIFPKDDFDEAKIICNQIKLLNDRGVEFKDFAIIYRSNDLSEKFEKELIRLNIPYQVSGKMRLLNCREIEILTSLMQILIGDINITNLKKLNKVCFNVKDKYLTDLNNYASYNDLSLQKYIETYGDELHSFMDRIYYIRGQANILYWYDWFDLLVKELDDKHNQENVSIFRELFLDFCDSYVGSDKVTQFVHKLSMLKSLTIGVNKVNLTTIHASKGLEFDYVYLPAFEDGIIPSFKAIEEDDIEEERRLAYVAFTRAKKKLVISCCHTRNIFGKFYSLPPSRYIGCLDKNIFNIPKSFEFNDKWGDEYSNIDVVGDKKELEKTKRKNRHKKAISRIFY